jgi:hypothetical protein
VCPWIIVSAVKARLLTFVALAGSPARPAGQVQAPDLEAETALFGVEIRPRASEFADTVWRPRFGHVREWSPSGYGAPNAGSAYTVERCRTAIVTVPMAGDLLLVDLEFMAEGTDGLILAEKDAFDPSLRLTLDGQDLLTAAGVLGWRLTDLRRQVLLLPGGPEALFGHDPTALDPSREALLRQLMFKDVDISYRPGLAPVSVPIDMNGPDRQSVFVWDTNTVVEGLSAYPHLVDLRVLGIAMVNAQIVGALKRCTEIREEATRATDPNRVGELTAAPAEVRRVQVEDRLLRIGALRQDLSVGVEMHALATAVAGGRPLLRYHEAVVTESPLPHLLRVSEHLLGQLAESVRLEKDLLDVAESRETAREQLAIASATRGLLDQSEAFKAASLVFAAVAAVISLAGLFAAVASVPRAQSQSLLGSAPNSALFVVVALVVAAVAGAGLRAASRLRVRPLWRVPLRVVRWLLFVALVGFIGLALSTVWAHPGASSTLVLFIAGSAICATLLVFALALELNFEPPVSTVVDARPVRVEVWPVTVSGGEVYRHPAAPFVDTAGADIASVAARAGTVRYLHSTSWRFADGGVVLTYLAVVDGLSDLTGWRPVRPLPPSGGTTEEDVLQHALGHLAFLIERRHTEASEFAGEQRGAFSRWQPVVAGQVDVPSQRAPMASPHR